MKQTTIDATRKAARRIEFEGNHQNDSLLIGNFGDVEFMARGEFDLSGMIYSKNTVEFTVIGSGQIRFHGVCKKIIIHLVKGDCTVDFSRLTSKEVCCVSLRDNSRTLVGPTQIISRANLQDDAVLTYNSKSLLRSYSVAGRSRIQLLEE